MGSPNFCAGGADQRHYIVNCPVYVPPLKPTPRKTYAATLTLRVPAGSEGSLGYSWWGAMPILPAQIKAVKGRIIINIFETWNVCPPKVGCQIVRSAY